jgi:SAM-dependent methyltransferase
MSDEDETVQGRITAFWNVVAPGYDTPANVAAPGSAEYSGWSGAIRSVLPEEPSEVLDVGTGTGFVARIAAELGHRVTGIDLSESMLEAAREGSAGSGLDVRFVVGDAVRPPFPPECFDVVISRSVIWTLREPLLAFRNWHALLRPGGRVVAIYGLEASTPEDAGSADEPEGLFEQHYTRETRAALPAMRLREHDPLLQMAERAELLDVTTTPLEVVRGWETSPGSDLPYALVGWRP